MSSEDEKLLKEAKKLPWEDRLLHKNWKVRNDANIDLAAFCDSITDPKDPRLREFGPLFRKTVADSNAPVQEKALDALIAYLRAADADAGRYGKEVCDAIVTKCLTGRPKTVEKAQAVFLLWVELEAVDAFLDAMEKAIKNKVAKAVVPAIDVMFQALSEFGSKIVPPKRILKMLPELFDHQDQNVRASSKGVTLELCRWIGKEPVKSILFEKMRDTMRKELEAELVNVTGTARPSRKIRSEQDKEPEPEAASEVVGSGPSEESAAEIPQEIDEYEVVDPVDILTPLEKSGFWDGVNQPPVTPVRNGGAPSSAVPEASTSASPIPLPPLPHHIIYFGVGFRQYRVPEVPLQDDALSWLGDRLDDEVISVRVGDLRSMYTTALHSWNLLQFLGRDPLSFDAEYRRIIEVSLARGDPAAYFRSDTFSTARRSKSRALRRSRSSISRPTPAADPSRGSPAPVPQFHETGDTSGDSESVSKRARQD